MRILIVEDDLEIGEILQILCEEEGHECRTAATVQSAAVLWQEWAPACIFLDLKLPGDPATVFVRHIRLTGDRTPIIVISGNLEPRWVAELQHFGVTAIVAKPFTAEQIVDLLRAICPPE
jgi:DNA-binding response OmpR family regulator